MADPYRGIKVGQLRRMLASRGLDPNGSRPELIERLGPPSAPAVAVCSRFGRRRPTVVRELGADDRFADLGVRELRDALRFAGLATDGAKSDLIDRLRASVPRSAVGRHTRSHRRRNRG